MVGKRIRAVRSASDSLGTVTVVGFCSENIWMWLVHLGYRAGVGAGSCWCDSRIWTVAWILCSRFMFLGLKFEQTLKGSKARILKPQQWESSPSFGETPEWQPCSTIVQGSHLQVLLEDEHPCSWHCDVTVSSIRMVQHASGGEIDDSWRVFPS